MTAITITDLNNAKRDVDHIAELATSVALTATDRLGNVKRTMSGALAEYPNAFANAASAAASASASEASRLASGVSAGLAAASATAATTNGAAQVALATAAKVAAELARDAAMVSGKVYAATAAGLAATTTTQYFSVPSADSDESLILYLNNAGAAVEQKRYPSAAKLDQFLSIAAPGYAYCIVDPDGVVALGVKVDGAVEISKLLLESLDASRIGTLNTTLSDETLPGFVLSMLDSDGISGGGWRTDGTFAVGALEATSLNGVPVANFLTPGGSSAAAVGLGNFDAEINHFLSYGQSRAVGVDSLPVITTAQRFDNLKFNGGVRATDAGGTVAANHASFQPLVETALSTTSGETPVTGATDFIKELILAENGISFTQQSYQMLGSAPGAGGTPISGLISPGGAYPNVTADISYGYSLSQAAGKTYKVRAFDWMQGESDYQSNTVGATYKAQLIQLRTDISNFAKTTTGQTEEVICIQDQLCDHGTYGHANDPYIALIQLDLAKTQPFFYMSCPTYFATPGGVHHSATASKWIGAYHGMVYKRVVIDKADWKPMSPVSSYRQGSIALVKLRLPTSKPLAFDVVSVPSQTNKGFTLVNASNVAITISSVTITGKDTVKIVAATAIPAGAKLRYGFGGIGNLRDTQGDTLVFGGGGLNLPMHNWCCIFEETLV